MTPTTSQDTRQRLIEAAIFTFAEKGFEGAGIREIARRAKANSALVQYYFESKEGLYLAAMEYFFTQCPTTVPTLPPPPAPDAPHAQVEAARSLRRYIRAFLDDLFLKHEVIGHTKEMNTAAHLFWIREIHEREPVPERMALMRQYLRPYSDYMRACLLALCPHLDQESLFLTGSSLIAQILYFHRDRAIITLLRGKPYGPADIESLSRHIATFSFRGLGLPEDLGA